MNMGGMEQFVVRIAAEQRSHGLDAFILAMQPGPLMEDAYRRRVPVKLIASSNKEIRFMKAVLTFLSSRPQVIHSHNPTSLHYAALGKSLLKSVLVMTDHGQGAGPGRVPSLREQNLVDAIISVSQDTKSRREASWQNIKSHVIYNGVDTSSSGNRDATRRTLELGDRVTGIIVARIDTLKGHDTLLTATAELKTRYPKLVILIVGDGTERSNREKLAHELGLDEKKVRFLGFRSDIPDLLAASDFFVLPSLTEGLPLSVLEAMSMKLPVIATSVGGIPELVTDGETGILIPPKDPVALAEAMARIIGDPDLRKRMGEAGYRRVVNHFSFDTMTKKYEELYYSLLNGSARHSLPFGE